MVVFKIGSLKFLVAGTSPHKLGKVSTSTVIRCSETVDEGKEVEYIEIVPMRRNQFPSAEHFREQVVAPYLQSLRPREMHVFKHGIIELDNLRFFIRYQRPEYGYLSSRTKVRIADYIKPLSFVRLAPIWKDEETCREVMENFDEYEQDIRNNYLDVYFKGGLT